jgi:hypothetical protein
MLVNKNINKRDAVTDKITVLPSENCVHHVHVAFTTDVIKIVTGNSFAIL